MTELKEDVSDISDEESYKLDFLLPNNDQTWLYISPGCDPNVVEDLSEWLSKSPNFIKERKQDHVIDSRTFTRSKKQSTTVNGGQMNSCADPLMIIEESKFVQETSAQVHQEIKDNQDSNKVTDTYNSSHTAIDSQINLPNNENAKHAEFGPLLTENLSLLMDYTCPNLSFNSCDISQVEISRHCNLPSTIGSPSQMKIIQNLPVQFKPAPYSDNFKTSTCNNTPQKSAFLFSPKANSTPTASLCLIKDNSLNLSLNLKINQSATTEMLDNTNNNILGETFDFKNNNLINEEGNNTFSVPLASEDCCASIPFEDANNATFSLPFVEDDKILSHFGPKVDCKNYFVSNPLYNTTEGPQLTNESDAALPILSSKIDVANMNQYIGQVSKERDDDSAPDSCYSSSSNIRSLGDVHIVSQQPENLRYNNIRKAVSHDSLLSQPVPTNVTVSEKHESDANLTYRTASSYELPKEIVAPAVPPKGTKKCNGANKCKEKSKMKLDATIALQGG